MTAEPMIEQAGSKGLMGDTFTILHGDECPRHHHLFETAAKDCNCGLDSMVAQARQLTEENVAQAAQITQLLKEFADVVDLKNNLDDKIAQLTQERHVCGVCWTASFEPVPEEASCDLSHPHDDEHLRCLACWQQKRLMQLTQEIAEHSAAGKALAECLAESEAENAQLTQELAGSEQYGRSCDSVMEAMNSDLERLKAIHATTLAENATLRAALEVAEKRLAAYDRLMFVHVAGTAFIRRCIFCGRQSYEDGSLIDDKSTHAEWCEIVEIDASTAVKEEGS